MSEWSNEKFSKFWVGVYLRIRHTWHSSFSSEDIINLSDTVLIKGKKQKLTLKLKNQIIKQGETLAKEGLRVLALSFKNMPSYIKSLDESYVNKLTLVGLVAMKDPPREGVGEAIQKARNAGIRIIMKTGDHKETALAIAKEIGLASEKDKVLTQQDLEKLNDKQYFEYF